MRRGRGRHCYGRYRVNLDGKGGEAEAAEVDDAAGSGGLDGTEVLHDDVGAARADLGVGRDHLIQVEVQRLQPREVAALEREDRHGVAVQPKVRQVCELAHLRGDDRDAVVVDAQRGERSEPLARLAREARQLVVREPELCQRLHAADAQRKLADRVGR